MVVREIPRGLYAAFVGNHPASLVFHQPPWLDAVAHVYGVRFCYLGFYDDMELVGVLPVFVMKRLFLKFYGSPLRKVGTPPAVPILVQNERCPAVFQALERWVRQGGIKHFQITWAGDEPRPTSAWMRVETTDNLEVDLSGTIETLWKNLSELPRRKVRHAVRQGVKMHWIGDAAFISRYSELLASTYKHQGLRPNFRLPMYRRVMADLPKKSLRILAATYGDRIIAAAWLLCSKDRCHYWDASSLQEHKELSAGHLLMWEAIRWSKARGFKIFDMVGASVGGRGGMRPGIGRFKKSFGAEPVTYCIVYWQSWWLRSTLNIYRTVMNARNRIGLQISRVLLRKDRETKTHHA